VANLEFLNCMVYQFRFWFCEQGFRPLWWQEEKGKAVVVFSILRTVYKLNVNYQYYDNDVMKVVSWERYQQNQIFVQYVSIWNWLWLWSHEENTYQTTYWSHLSVLGSWQLYFMLGWGYWHHKLAKVILKIFKIFLKLLIKIAFITIRIDSFVSATM
jgi:hypothetical protein